VIDNILIRCDVRKDLKLLGGENGIVCGEGFSNDSHTTQDLLLFQPTTDDLDADGKAVHGVRIVKLVEGAGDVVHVSVFRAGGEIAGKGIDGFVNERDWQATG